MKTTLNLMVKGRMGRISCELIDWPDNLHKGDIINLFDSDLLNKVKIVVDSRELDSVTGSRLTSYISEGLYDHLLSISKNDAKFSEEQGFRYLPAQKMKK